MKIKLAILEKDQAYLGRMVSAFSTKYADKFEIYSFTDPNVALDTLDIAKIDVLLASDAFDLEFSRVPKRCAFSYLVDSMDIETVNGQHAICKFQKADLIYKQILGVYSENASNVSGFRLDDASTKIIVFEPVSGGVGASTVAAACAIHFAEKKKKTLYLNFEKYGSSDCFFSAEGNFDMSDIIFALKSKKTNLAMKLESCVKQADNGVYFFSQSKTALDMAELTPEEMLRMISELKMTGSYDYIIVDMDFSLEEEMLKIYRKFNSVVWVGDGSEISNVKLFRSINALNVVEQNAESPLTNRLSLIYNKFSNKTGKILENIGVKNIGGAPKYEHATTAQILGQISPMDCFEKLI